MSIFGKHYCAFLALGFSPLARFGEKYPRSWSDYCLAQATKEQCAKWGKVEGANIALACGYRGLLAIDVDTDDPIIKAAVLEALPHCRIGRFGSKGFALLCRHDSGEPRSFKHIYTGEGPEKRPLVEIKGQGNTITVPPSIHAKTGSPYIWLDPETGELAEGRPAFDELPVVTDADLERLRVALLPWTSKPRAAPAPRPKTDANHATEPSSLQVAAYFQGGFARGCREVGEQKEGGRNRKLFAEVCQHAWAVHHNIVGEPEFIDGFVEACRANGSLRDDGLHAVRATIDNGIGKAAGDPIPPNIRREPKKPATGKRGRPAKGGNGGGSGGGSGGGGGGGGDGPIGDLPPEDGQGACAPEPAKKANGKWDTDGDNKKIKNKVNLEHALRLENISLQYDEFSHEYQIFGFKDYGPRLDDTARNDLWELIWSRYNMKFSDRDFKILINIMAMEKKVNPAREYLDKCQSEWDGMDRLDEWIATYLGAEQNRANAFIGRAMLIAAVRRVRHPGCKFDHMVVLEGPEAAGKSTAVTNLCPTPEWFTDNFSLTLNTQQIIQLTAGKMLVEIGELSGMRKSEVEHVKATVSRQHDEARLPYAHDPVRRSRGFIFIGTTNETAYLLSQTGNRRFWPVKCGKIDSKGIARDRDQLWGEAAYLEAKGEAVFATDQKVLAGLNLAQREREIADPWDEKIETWLRNEEIFHNRDPKKHGKVFKVTLGDDIWKGALEMKEIGRIGQMDYTRMARCMSRLNWKKGTHSCGNNWWIKMSDEEKKSANSP